MKNPYWHNTYKPHLTDRNEIRLLCFNIYTLVTSSMSRQGSGIALDEGETESPEFPEIDELCFNMSETELSRNLLRLALLVRTFDETLSRDEQAEAYTEHRKRVENKNGEFGAVYEGPPNQLKTLRSCCNKIIHAEDVRPVYETGNDRNDPNAMWGMNGIIELEGFQGPNRWFISLLIHSYLEGILELIKFQEI